MAAVPPAHCAPSVDRVRDMSLFHDFKLKRRKVDSRGSSDGEGFSEMTNLSPELSEGGGKLGPTDLKPLDGPENGIGGSTVSSIRLKKEAPDPNDSRGEAESMAA